MENVAYVSEVPGSSFTVGDLVEAQLKCKDGSFEKVVGRITINWENKWLISVIEEGVDDEGTPWKDSHISYYLNDPKLAIKNIRVLEPGPWHAIVCGGK